MKKIKKFGRGGDILTGLGAGLLGYAAYKGLTKDKDDKTDKTDVKLDRNKLISEEVDKAQNASKKEKKVELPSEDDRRAAIAEKNPQYYGGNPKDKPGGGGNVGTRINTASPNSAASRTSDEIKSNILDQRPAQQRIDTSGGKYEGPAVPGVNEKDLERRQRRNVVTKKRKVAASSRQGSNTNTGLDAGIAVGEQTNKTEQGEAKSGSGKLWLSPERLEQSRNAMRPLREQQAREIKELFRGTDAEAKEFRERQLAPFKKGGAVKKYASGGSVKTSKMGSVKTAKPTMRSASARADGIAIRGKTRA